MNQTILFLLFSLFFNFSQSLHAQERQSPLVLKFRVKSDKSVEFYYEKTDPGTYTVAVNLRNLVNATALEQESYLARGYQGTLFTLSPDKEGSSVGFSYSYLTFRGSINPKVDSGFIYTLPFKRGHKVSVGEAGNLSARYFGSETPKDWKVYRFYTDEQDTVLSVRKGTVIAIVDDYEPDTINSLSYTSKMNEIIIEHEDGTLARYSGLKKGSFRVQVGQKVYPLDPLGVNTRYSKDSKKYSVTFYLSYLKSFDFEGGRGTSLKNPKSYYGYITPKFYVKDQGVLQLIRNKFYVADYTPEMLTKELTKKELKQFNTTRK